MPTISRLRRRGVTPEALRDFAYHIGVTKYNGVTDVAVLEHAIRADLNTRALRRLGVLRPLRVVITNYPEGQVEQLTAANHPSFPETGSRSLPFSRKLFIEQDDFMEVAPPKYFRLDARDSQPGRPVFNRTITLKDAWVKEAGKA